MFKVATAMAVMAAAATAAPVDTKANGVGMGNGNGNGRSTVTGRFTQIAEDTDFITPKRRYLIEDDAGVLIELEFDGAVPESAHETPHDGTIATANCGNELPPQARAEGRLGKTKCKVDTFAVNSRPRRSHYNEAGRPGITVGTRTWIVTMLQIPGNSATTVTEAMRQAVYNRIFPKTSATNFGTTTTGATCNDRYEICSNNQFDIRGDVYIADTDPGIANSCSSVNYFTMGDQGWTNSDIYAKAQGDGWIATGATSATGVTQVIVLPSGSTGCPIGVGYLCGDGCGGAVTANDAGTAAYAMGFNYRFRTDTYLHEMGHNQGMHHSGDQGGNEYADTSNFMGYASAQMKCTNSPHMRYLGWTDAEDRALHDPAVSGTKMFTLQPLSSNHRGGTDLGHISTVIVPAGSGQNFYFAYRAKTMGDNGIGTKYANRVEAVLAGSSNAITRRQMMPGSTNSMAAGDEMSGMLGADVAIRVASVSGGVATVIIGKVGELDFFCATSADCDDADVCTTDTCNAGSGTCGFEVVADCCSSNAECNAGTCKTSSCSIDNTCTPAEDVVGCCASTADCSQEGLTACQERVCTGSNTCEVRTIAGCCLAAGDCTSAGVCQIGSCGAGNTCEYTREQGCCNNDGTCDVGDGESCDACPALATDDCFNPPASACGDGVCDVDGSEDCYSCPQDCNGRTSGKRNRRYCCGSDTFCGDSRCGGVAGCADGVEPDTGSCKTGGPPPPTTPPSPLTTVPPPPCANFKQSCSSDGNCCLGLTCHWKKGTCH